MPKPRTQKQATQQVGKPDTSGFRPLSQQLLDYFGGRGISRETLERNQVAQEHTWMPGQPPGIAVAFPYMRNGEVCFCKRTDMLKPRCLFAEKCCSLQHGHVHEDAE